VFKVREQKQKSRSLLSNCSVSTSTILC